MSNAIQATLVRPINDQVLVRQDPPKDKIGSFYVPQGKEEYPPLATVLAIGPGAVNDHGVRIPLDVKDGDRVLFKRRPGTALVPDWSVRASSPFVESASETPERPETLEMPEKPLIGLIGEVMVQLTSRG